MGNPLGAISYVNAYVELLEQAEEKGYMFTGVEIDRTVKGGDRIPCGDLTLEIIDAPGHSSCSIDRPAA